MCAAESGDRIVRINDGWFSVLASAGAAGKVAGPVGLRGKKWQTRQREREAEHKEQGRVGAEETDPGKGTREGEQRGDRWGPREMRERGAAVAKQSPTHSSWPRAA